jgi:hypothetical protein
MPESDKDQWLKTLEMVARKRPDEVEAEWAWVMKELGLGPDYFLAVYEAVRQGRWRAANDPGSYLKTVARREAWGKVRGPRGVGPGFTRPGDEDRELRRVRGNRSDYGEEMTIGYDGPEMDGEHESSEDRLDFLQYRQDSGKPMQAEDGVWRSGAGWGARNDGGMRKPKRRRKPTGAGRPLMVDPAKCKPPDPYYQTYVDPQPERMPDWAKMAAVAGLTEWEKKVVAYMMSGTGWRKAWAAQPDEESRRALRAAWKRLERTGLRRLQEAAKNSFPQSVAKEGDWDTE